MSDASLNPPSLASFDSGHTCGTLSTFANLLSKELRESRAVIIIGLWSFWLMPACIELLYFLYGAIINHDIDIATGVAWGALIIVGWLYAVVVGAHVVCRDWGKAEEHFLASRPVSVTSIVVSKLLTGLIVIISVAMVAVLWDVGLAVFDEGLIFLFRFSNDFTKNVFVISIAIVIASVMIVGFIAAFATAVVTRQMLTSVLVGVLVLLIWLVGPMLSRDLQSLYPAWLHHDFDGDQLLKGIEHKILSGSLLFAGHTFPFIVIGTAIACIATALIAAPRERTLQVSHKTLAWAMAVVVLVMFGFAMHEVGASLNVCDSVRPFEPGVTMGYRHETLFARQGEHCVAISRGVKYKRGAKNSPSAIPMISFRVDDTGKVHDLQQVDLIDNMGPSTRLPSLSDLLGVKINDTGDYIITGKCRSSYSPNSIDLLCRLHIRWPAERKPEIVSQTVAGLSEEIQERQEKNKKIMLRSYASTDHWAYLVYATAPIEPDGKIDWSSDSINSWPHALYVFDWTTKPKSKIIHEIPVPPGTRFKIFDYMLFIESTRRAEKRWQGEKAACPVDNPTFVVELLSRPEDEWLKAMKPTWRPFLRTDPRYDHDRGHTWDTQRSTRFESDRWGIRVQQFTDANKIHLEEIGRYLASPIGALFREGRYSHDLNLIDNKTLLELTRQTLSVYDVSNVLRPRRLGFFHLAHNQRGPAWVFSTDSHLLLLEGSYLTVLEHPRAGVMK